MGMKVSKTKMYGSLPAALIFVLVWGYLGQAASFNLSGSWHLVANGKSYVLELTQRGKKIFGTLIPVNNSRRLDSTVAGSVWDGRVSFTTMNQEHSVVLKFEGVVSGSGNSMAMSGTFSYNSMRNRRWYAIRW